MSSLEDYELLSTTSRLAAIDFQQQGRVLQVGVRSITNYTHVLYSEERLPLAQYACRFAGTQAHPLLATWATEFGITGFIIDDSNGASVHYSQLSQHINEIPVVSLGKVVKAGVLNRLDLPGEVNTCHMDTLIRNGHFPSSNDIQDLLSFFGQNSLARRPYHINALSKASVIAELAHLALAGGVFLRLNVLGINHILNKVLQMRSGPNNNTLTYINGIFKSVAS